MTMLEWIGRRVAARAVEQERQFRELTAYCEQNSIDGDRLGDDYTEGSINAYADVAARLREILK